MINAGSMTPHHVKIVLYRMAELLYFFWLYSISYLRVCPMFFQTVTPHHVVMVVCAGWQSLCTFVYVLRDTVARTVRGNMMENTSTRKIYPDHQVKHYDLLKSLILIVHCEVWTRLSKHLKWCTPLFLVQTFVYPSYNDLGQLQQYN